MLLLLTTCVSAQLPKPFLTKTTVALFSADVLVRSLDAASTRHALTDPCQCHKEDNIPAIASRSSTMYAYSLGIAGLNTFGAYELHKRHHDRLAHALMAVELGYETKLVVNNYRLK